MLLKLPAPAFPISVKVGIEKSKSETLAKLMVLNNGCKIEKRIVVAGVFPIEESYFGCRDDIGGDQVVVAAAKVMRLTKRLDDVGAMCNKIRVGVLNFRNVAARGDG